MSRLILEDPDGAPYPEPVQEFYNSFGAKFFDEQALEDFGNELRDALEATIKAHGEWQQGFTN